MKTDREAAVADEVATNLVSAGHLLRPESSPGDPDLPGLGSLILTTGSIAICARIRTASCLLECFLGNAIYNRVRH